MVHIFAGEEHHIANIKSLIEVLTSATLTIFQQGNKNLELITIYFKKLFCIFSSYIYFTGPRDHPDIAESFMNLHAQVGCIYLSIVMHTWSSQAALDTYFVLHLDSQKET